MPTQAPPIVHALRFRWLTPAYDLVVAATPCERTVKAALLAQARIASTHRVLDLASGTGTLAILAKRRQPGAEIIAIDADSAITSIACCRSLFFQHRFPSRQTGHARRGLPGAAPRR